MQLIKGCHSEPVRHSSALRAAAKRRLRSARACGRSGVGISFKFAESGLKSMGIATLAVRRAANQNTPVASGNRTTI